MWYSRVPCNTVLGHFSKLLAYNRSLITICNCSGYRTHIRHDAVTHGTRIVHRCFYCILFYFNRNITAEKIEKFVKTSISSAFFLTELHTKTHDTK